MREEKEEKEHQGEARHRIGTSNRKSLRFDFEEGRRTPKKNAFARLVPSRILRVRRLRRRVDPQGGSIVVGGVGGRLFLPAPTRSGQVRAV